MHQNQDVWQPKISIITIVYNDKDHILETMESIISQTYPHIEYIIIDGKSFDGTTQIIESKITSLATITKKNISKDSSLPESSATLYLEAKLNSNPHFSFKFLSQKDSGIYDAMNKGIDLASGVWCNFMNSGDRFYNESCVLELFKQYNSYIANGGGAVFIIYGDTQIFYSSTESKILKSKTASHKYHHHFIHQSSFIESSLMKRYKYDTKFKIAGDTEFFTKAYNNGFGFKHFDVVISSFNVEGISSSLSFRMFIEDCQIGARYNVLFPLWHMLKYIFWIIPRVIIRNAIPKRFRNKARILFGKKYH